MRAVLDTHAWLWWVMRDARLSATALDAVERGQSERTLWVSAFSIWEVAKKVQEGQLVLDRPLDDWLDQATTPTGLHVAEVTRAVLVESCRLPGGFAGDPADAIIVATARSLAAVLVTKDQRIRGYNQVRTIW